MLGGILILRSLAQEKWISVSGGNYGMFMFIYLLNTMETYNAHRFRASHVLISSTLI